METDRALALSETGRAARIGKVVPIELDGDESDINQMNMESTYTYWSVKPPLDGIIPQESEPSSVRRGTHEVILS